MEMKLYEWMNKFIAILRLTSYKYLNIQEINLNELHKYRNLMRQMAYYN